VAIRWNLRVYDAFSLHERMYRTIIMSDRRRSTHGMHIAGALVVGLLALSLAYAVPAIAPLQHAEVGASVHAKNSATPGWILELQTRNARQSPVTAENDEPSFWI
jgi:hypothetical protein